MEGGRRGNLTRRRRCNGPTRGVGPRRREKQKDSGAVERTRKRKREFWF